MDAGDRTVMNFKSPLKQCTYSNLLDSGIDPLKPEDGAVLPYCAIMLRTTDFYRMQVHGNFSNLLLCMSDFSRLSSPDFDHVVE
jgi:hypothetical protein